MKTAGIIVDFQEKLRKMSAFHAGHTFSENQTYIYKPLCIYACMHAWIQFSAFYSRKNKIDSTK